MRSGALDRLIYIQRKVTGFIPDANGVITPIRNPGTPMRAELLETTSSDVAHDSGRTTKTVVSFRTRFLDRISAGDTLRYDNRSFEIQIVKEIGRRKGLEITAKET